MGSNSVRKIDASPVQVVSHAEIVVRLPVSSLRTPDVGRHGKSDRNVALLLSIVATLSIVIAGFLVDVDSTTPIRGYVDAQQGAVQVQVQAPGVLSKWLVKQGDFVHRGQSIGVVTREKVGIGDIAVLPRNMELLQKQQTTIESGINDLAGFLKDDAAGYAAMVSELESQMALVSDAYAAKKSEIGIYADRLARAEGLGREGYISKEAIEDKRSGKLKVEGEALTLLQQLKALRTSSAQTKQGLLMRKASTLAQISSLKRALSDLSRETNQYSADNNLEIVVPTDGIVGNLTVQEGYYVEPSRAVATIVNGGGAYIARLVIPPKGIGQVDVGSRVSLYLDAFPFRQFGHISGTIKQIDATYISPRDQVGPVVLTEPAYCASIKISDDEAEKALRKRLRPGMLFDVHVANRQYSVFGWLANRLFRFQ